MPSPQATFRTRLRAGEPLVGSIVTMPLAFFVGIAASLFEPESAAAERFAALSSRVQLGPAADAEREGGAEIPLKPPA